MDEFDSLENELHKLTKSQQWLVHRILNGGQLWYGPHQVGATAKLADALFGQYPAPAIRQAIETAKGEVK